MPEKMLEAKFIALLVAMFIVLFVLHALDGGAESKGKVPLLSLLK